MTGSRRKRSRKGVLSTLKSPGRSKRRLPLWQWIVVTPLLLLLGGMILGFIYFSLVHPKLARGTQSERTTVIERKAVDRPDGTVDPTHSYLLVRIRGHEVRLAPQPNWNTIAVGDTLQVDFVEEADGSLRAITWHR